MSKTFSKYQMMRVRMKISFHAFIKNETISELWLKTIGRSIKFLIGSGQLPKENYSFKAQQLNNLNSNLMLNFKTIAKI